MLPEVATRTSAAQSSPGLSGGLPNEVKEPPVMLATLPVCSAPPFRGSNHRTSKAPLTPVRSRPPRVNRERNGRRMVEKRCFVRFSAFARRVVRRDRIVIRRQIGQAVGIDERRDVSDVYRRSVDSGAGPAVHLVPGDVGLRVGIPLKRRLGRRCGRWSGRQHEETKTGNRKTTIHLPAVSSRLERDGNPTPRSDRSPMGGLPP